MLVKCLFTATKFETIERMGFWINLDWWLVFDEFALDSRFEDMVSLPGKTQHPQKKKNKLANPGQIEEPVMTTAWLTMLIWQPVLLVSPHNFLISVKPKHQICSVEWKSNFTKMSLSFQLVAYLWKFLHFKWIIDEF